MLRRLLSPGGVSQPLSTSLARQRIIREERERAVQAYRALKQQRRPGLSEHSRPAPRTSLTGRRQDASVTVRAGPPPLGLGRTAGWTQHTLALLRPQVLALQCRRGFRVLGLSFFLPKMAFL